MKAAISKKARYCMITTILTFWKKQNHGNSKKSSVCQRLMMWRNSESTKDFLTGLNWTEVAQSCPTLCSPMDCSPPGSSVHGILPVRILEWVVISFSRGSSQPRDWTQASHIVGRHFNLWATREAPKDF